MNNSKLPKLLGLIVGIVLLNVIILSPGLIGLRIGGDSVLQTALGVTLLVISFLVLLNGSYSLLFKPPAPTPVKDIIIHEDYIEALNHYRGITPLKSDIVLSLDQLERIDKKKGTLTEVLGQRFDSAELSYKKFNSVINEVEKLFYLNVRGLLNKLSVFDASEFSALANQQASGRFSNKLIQEKKLLYDEYIASIRGYIGANEEILLKLDKLLLEITQLGSTDYKDVEEMPCMKEIDALINQTKFYKQ